MLGVEHFNTTDNSEEKYPDHAVITANIINDSNNNKSYTVYLNSKARKLYVNPQGIDKCFIFLGRTSLPSLDIENKTIKNIDVLGLTADKSPIPTVLGTYKPAVYYPTTGNFTSKKMNDVCRDIASKYQNVDFDKAIALEFILKPIKDNICSVTYLGYTSTEEKESSIVYMSNESIVNNININEYIPNYTILLVDNDDESNINHPHVLNVDNSLTDTEKVEIIDKFMSNTDIYGKDFVIDSRLQPLVESQIVKFNSDAINENNGIDYSLPTLPNVGVKYTKQLNNNN